MNRKKIMVSMCAALTISGASTIYADSTLDQFDNSLYLNVNSTNPIATITQEGDYPGGDRNVTLSLTSPAGFANIKEASGNDGNGFPIRVLGISTSSNTSVKSKIEYGAQQDLNIDIDSMGVRLIELDILGDLDDSVVPRPIPLNVTITSGAGDPATEISVTSSILLLDDGRYHVPFSEFKFRGVDLNDVDYISFEFDGSEVDAADFALINGFRFATPPVN